VAPAVPKRQREYSIPPAQPESGEASLISLSETPRSAKRHKVSPGGSLARFARASPAPNNDGDGGGGDGDGDSIMSQLQLPTASPNPRVGAAPAAPSGGSSPPVDRPRLRTLDRMRSLESGRGSSRQANSTQQPAKSLRWPWLDRVRDIEGRAPDDPEYDPATYFVPQDAWKNMVGSFPSAFFTYLCSTRSHSAINTQTAVKVLYWKIKQHNYDTIVWYQQGSFFNVFERDADILHDVLGLAYTHGPQAREKNLYSAGVHRGSLEQYNARLLAMGYRTCVVSQVDADAEQKKQKKFVPERTVDRIFTPGTCSDPDLLPDEACFLVSLFEVSSDATEAGVVGLVALDAAAGTVQLGVIQDDPTRSSTEAAILALGNVRELVVARDNLSPATREMLERTTGAHFSSNGRSGGGSCAVNVLRSQAPKSPIPRRDEFAAAEFWTAENTAQYLDSFRQFPEVLRRQLAEEADGDPLISALGGFLGYLRRIKFDEAVVAQNNFCVLGEAPLSAGTSRAGPRFVALDGSTLRNLDVMECHSSGPSGQLRVSLLSLLQQYAHTKMGKRELRRWVARPLAQAAAIIARNSGVVALRANDTSSNALELGSRLSRLPDLDRDLSKVLQGTATGVQIAHFVQGVETSVDILRSAARLEAIPPDSALGTILRRAELDRAARFLQDLSQTFDSRATIESGSVVVSADASGDTPLHKLLAELRVESERSRATEEALDGTLKRLNECVASRSIRFHHHRSKGRYLLEVPVAITNGSSSWQGKSLILVFCFLISASLTGSLQPCRSRWSAVCVKLIP
jgi:DNA mismatch repair protein MSH6